MNRSFVCGGLYPVNLSVILVADGIPEVIVPIQQRFPSVVLKEDYVIYAEELAETNEKFVKQFENAILRISPLLIAIGKSRRNVIAFCVLTILTAESNVREDVDAKGAALMVTYVYPVSETFEESLVAQFAVAKIGPALPVTDGLPTLQIPTVNYFTV